jgi:hypothetical protein
MGAFHLWCQGKHDYKPKPGFENRWHLIGDGDNPVLIIKKGEVQSLFNDRFYHICDLWKNYHYGKNGLIDFREMELDPEIVDCIIAMEQHHEMNFSSEYVMIKYLEALLKITAKKPSLR